MEAANPSESSDNYRTTQRRITAYWTHPAATASILMMMAGFSATLVTT
jgi:hypothetical protein